MKMKSSPIIRIAHALLFAALILLSATLLADTDHVHSATLLLVAVWFGTAGLIEDGGKAAWREVACIGRVLGIRRASGDD